MILKQEYRKRLRKPLGEVIKSEEELVKKIRNREIITIGDEATQVILKLKIKPKLAIVDYRIRRKPIKYRYKSFLKRIRVINKAGTISSQAIQKIKEGLKDSNSLLEVEGEEDLLALPVILEVDKGALVLYGQPGRGIVLVEVTEDKKKEIRNLIEKCFKK